MFSGVFGGGGGGGSMGGFADMFEQQRRMRGPDMQVQMRISLQEAAEGVSRTVQIPTRNVSGKRESRSVKVDIPPGGLQPFLGLYVKYLAELQGMHACVDQLCIFCFITVIAILWSLCLCDTDGSPVIYQEQAVPH